MSRAHDELMHRVESELNSVCGYTGLVAWEHSGRVSGPRAVWSEATADRQNSRRLTTAVSRAWKLVAGWLHTLLHSQSARSRRSARDKLLHFRHDPPVWHKVDHSMVEEWYAFIRRQNFS